MSKQLSKINIGIVGYGNLGRGVELAIAQNPDLNLVAVFTRREPSEVKTVHDVKVDTMSNIEQYKDKIHVMILCGGSATDLPQQGPAMAAHYHTVDSFDNHGDIPAYYAAVDDVAAQHGHVSLISTGWDPGLFSLNRMMFEAILPEGKQYTFWGKGLSQGHSDAVRRVAGVKNGVQYTIPNETALRKIRAGEAPELSTRERHVRECYVVAEQGADLAQIEQDIKTMPNYFADYDTTVHFITEDELLANHTNMPHGGYVMRNGRTGDGSGTNQVMEFSIKLDNNPEFTASVLVACARAVYKLAQQGERGAKTIFDMPLGLLSPKSPAELRKELL